MSGCDMYLPCPRPGCDGRLVENGSPMLRCTWCGLIAERPNQPDTPVVTDIEFTPAIPGVSNLIGFVRCTIDGHLMLDLMVVRTRAGLRVVFPKRRDRRGALHQLVRPVNERTRAAIEQAILTAIASEVAS